MTNAVRRVDRSRPRWSDGLRALSLLVVLAGAPIADAADECSRGAWEEGTLVRVESGEFTLASGDVMRLAGLRRAPRTAGDRQAAWLRSLAGEAVRFRRAGSGDRWGVTGADVSLAGSAPIDLADLAVSEGLAIVDPSDGSPACLSALLRAEELARRARRGWWAEPGSILPAGDPDAIAREAGRFALVEGRVVSVGERRDRTYLNFGRDFARDFSVVIAKRDWAAMAGQGVDARSVNGRRVRVRGTVEMRRAPSMTIERAGAIEILPGQ